MLGRFGVAISVLAMLSGTCLAQVGSGERQPDASFAEDSSEQIVEPLVGDHWTYEVRDEIAGSVKFTNSNIITDVTPSEISIRTENLGNPGTGFLVYDHNWNLKVSPVWRYTPNDGTGIKTPLKSGASWKFQSDDSSGGRGANFKRTGTSRVLGEESVSTRAGTFNTFKIETAIKFRNVADPAKSSEYSETTWYAPSINHWVKRISKTYSNGHITQNISVELLEYGRR